MIQLLIVYVHHTCIYGSPLAAVCVLVQYPLFQPSIAGSEKNGWSVLVSKTEEYV